MAALARFKLRSLFVVAFATAIFASVISTKITNSKRWAKLNSVFLIAENGKQIGVAAGDKPVSRRDLELLSFFSSRIVEIDFTGEDLNECDFGFWGELHSIERLALSHAKIDPQFVKNLSQLRNIRVLDIRNLK